MDDLRGCVPKGQTGRKPELNGVVSRGNGGNHVPSPDRSHRTVILAGRVGAVQSETGVGRILGWSCAGKEWGE